MSENKWVTAFAPASIGNVGVGYDMLGLAIEGAGDWVSARRRNESGIAVKEVLDTDGNPHQVLDSHPDRNTASIAARALWDAAGPRGGLEVSVRKGISLQSGMGSSAASAVAGAVAANALLDEPLATEDLLQFALEGEKFASNGLHADNVAPSLVGGLVLCPTVMLPRIVSLPVPESVCSVLLHIDLQVNTAESRGGLRTNVVVEDWINQQGYLATFIAGCVQNDLDLMRTGLKDIVIEPQRTSAVPCFDVVRDSAIGNGALGCSLSGSGPSIFSLCESNLADKIASAMEASCRSAGFECRSWVSPLDAPGARIVDKP